MVGWLGPDWDRGYVKGREQGMAEELQRIIKLLEESDSVCADWAIALIKGKK
jgi:hypothetical protein